MNTSPALTLTAAEQLTAIEAIKSLFAARLHCLDLKEWEKYGDFHTEDVVSDSWVDLPDGAAPEVTGQVVGRVNLVAAIRLALGAATHITTVHHGHTPQIELLSDSTARGVWAMEDLLWWTHHGREEHFHGFGHYREEYRKVDGRWLIGRRILTRLRVDHTPDYFSYLSVSS